MKNMRLFVALNFSPEVSGTITQLQKTLRAQRVSGNYTDCSNLHLTLAFIGEYNDPDKVIEALHNVSFEPFRLSLEETTGSFGDILWVGVKKSKSLSMLASDVRKALEAEKIPFDRKQFKPHITVIRRIACTPEQNSFISALKIKNSEMTVNGFSLMYSHRENGRLIYTELSKIEAKRV